MKKTIKLIIATIGIMSVLSTQVFAFSSFTLDSDLDYNFQNKTKNEYYSSGTQNLNYNGVVPDYISDIYDLTPQPVLNSEYGANIIGIDGYDKIPSSGYGKAPSNAPVKNTVMPNVSQTNSYGVGGGTNTGGFIENTPNISSQGNTTYPISDTPIQETYYQDPLVDDYVICSSMQPTMAIIPNGYDSGYTVPSSFNGQNYTDKLQKLSDGSIGTLKISSVGINTKVYDGEILSAMKKGIGHIEGTGNWSGNIALAGHNRGSNPTFAKLKSVNIGDTITYTTGLGEKRYQVISVEKINETDWTKLGYTSDNRITLVTCVEDVPNLRYCIQGVEVQ